METSITIEVLGHNHVVKFDFAPGLVGYLPVFRDKKSAEDFLEEMGKGGGVEEIYALPPSQSDDTQT